MRRRFAQVDVFTDEPYLGNPVAVVVDGDGLTTEVMQRFASWTNLSETTFLTRPTSADADYAVRIFTPSSELPFAGHPTLGSCHAWLAASGRSAGPRAIVQQCAAGLVRVRSTADRLAFSAPPLVRGGPVDDHDLAVIVEVLGIERADVVDVAWADNGPGWVAVLLPSVDDVLAIRPAPRSPLSIGVVGLHGAGARTEPAVEVRAFFRLDDGTVMEDPVTGSLNASVGAWLLDTGRLPSPYVASQGTVLGRRGRVHVARDDDGVVWVGGGTVTCVEGTLEI